MHIWLQSLKSRPAFLTKKLKEDMAMSNFFSMKLQSIDIDQMLLEIDK